MVLTELQRRSAGRALNEFLEARTGAHGVRWWIEGDEITLCQCAGPARDTAVGEVPVLRLRFDPHEEVWCADYPDPRGGWSPHPESGRARSLVQLLDRLGRDPDALLW